MQEQGFVAVSLGASPLRCAYLNRTACGQGVRWVHNDLIGLPKSADHFNSRSKVSSDGDWNELRAAVANHSDTQPFCAKEQGVGWHGQGLRESDVRLRGL